MSFFLGNDMEIVSEVLTDNDGNPITTGVVEATVYSANGNTVLFAKAAMTHDVGGVWRLALQAEDIDSFPNTRVLIRITVGSPPDATFERIEQVIARRS